MISITLNLQYFRFLGQEKKKVEIYRILFNCTFHIFVIMLKIGNSSQ